MVTLLKATLLHGCFSRFKLYKWYQIAQSITYTDTQRLNENEASKITWNTTHVLPDGILLSRSFYLTVDNSGGKQKTITGSEIIN